MITNKTSVKDFVNTAGMAVPSAGVSINYHGIDHDDRVYLNVALDPHAPTAFNLLIRKAAYQNTADDARLDLAGALELGQSLINNDDIKYKDTESRDIFIRILEELETGFARTPSLEGRSETKESIHRLIVR